LRQAFGEDRLLSQIGVEDGDAYIEEHDDLSPKTLANHLTLLITMLNYVASFREPWILKVPRFKKPKIAVLGRNYSYLRTQDEIDRFLRAAKDEGDAIFMLYLAAVATGLRAGELAGLEWPDGTQGASSLPTATVECSTSRRERSRRSCTAYSTGRASHRRRSRTDARAAT